MADETTALAQPMSLEELRGMAGELPGDGTEHQRVRPPEVRLTQAGSQSPEALRHVGEFWHSDLEMYSPEVDALPIRLMAERALFGEDNALLCASDDGDRPRPEQPLWDEETGGVLVGREGQQFLFDGRANGGQPRTCQACPLSRRANDRPALCTRNFSLVILRREPRAAALLRIPGASVRAVFDHVDAMKRRRVPLYTQHVAFGSRQVTGEGRSYMALTIEPGRTVNRGELEEAVELARLFEAQQAMGRESGHAEPEPGSVGWDALTWFWSQARAARWQPADVLQLANAASLEGYSRADLEILLERMRAHRARPADPDDLPFE